MINDRIIIDLSRKDVIKAVKKHLIFVHEIDAKRINENDIEILAVSLKIDSEISPNGYHDIIYLYSGEEDINDTASIDL